MNKKFRARMRACHSRREVKAEEDVFFCAHPQVVSRGNLVNSWSCRHCRFRTQPPPERPLPFRPRGATLYDGPCQYLGQQRGLRECTSCKGSVKIKVFGCGHPEREETTIKECRYCGDFKPSEKATDEASPEQHARARRPAQHITTHSHGEDQT